MTAIGELTPRWSEISVLLDEALALPAAERARWVETAPIEPAELRDTLRRLLQAQAGVETGDFLETIAKLEPSGAPATVTGEPAAGDAVGPYRLQREIGRGGMGAVWLAERADGALKRQVALKLPRLAWDGALAERLARERDILASLEHPHIARLYDAGVDAAGRPWLAMEYVDGQPIDQFCRERGLDTRTRVRLLLDVAAAVAHAHRQQVLHRDLKPSNILVTADAQVRLLDFGIAKLMHDDRAAETALTRAAGRAMTPDYASPEQVRGDTLSVASDVYSLGVVAYELLAGDKPYRLKRGSAAELEEAVVSVTAPAASAMAANAATARALRGDLDAIIAQALRKEPERRYANVDALATDLRRHLDGERVHARPDSIAYRAARLWRGHTVAIGIGAAVLAALGAAIGFGPTALLVVVLVAGLAAMSWQTRRALAQARATRQQAARADAVQQFLVELLGSAGFGAISAEQRRSITAAQLLERAAARLQQRPAADPRVQEALLDVVIRVFQGLGMHQQVIDLGRDLVRRLDMRDAAASERARVHTVVGDMLIHCDDMPGAIESFGAALAVLEGATEVAAAPMRAHVLCKLGRAHMFIGQAAKGIELIQTATATRDWERGDAVMRGDILHASCWVGGTAGRLDEAEALLRQAIAADDVGRDALDLAALERRGELARLLVSLGRYAEAEPEFRRVLAAFESTGEFDHPFVMRFATAFARQLAATSRSTEGLDLIRRAMQAVENHPQRYAALERERLVLAQVELLLSDGQIGEAGILLGSCADALCTAREPVEASIAMVTNARYLTEVGRFTDALDYLQRALALRIGHFGPEHRILSATRNLIAMVLVASGRCDEALAAIDDILRAAPPRQPTERFGLFRDVAEGCRTDAMLDLHRPAEAVAASLDHLRRFADLPAGDQAPLLEVTLRLRAARCLLALHRLDEAEVQLAVLDRLIQPLHEQLPQRITVHAAKAHAFALSGRVDDARSQLQQSDRLLVAQGSLGPQYRRYPDLVRAMLSTWGVTSGSSGSDKTA